MARLTISLSDERHRALREAAATRHKRSAADRGKPWSLRHQDLAQARRSSWRRRGPRASLNEADAQSGRRRRDARRPGGDWRHFRRGHRHQRVIAGLLTASGTLRLRGFSMECARRVPVSTLRQRFWPSTRHVLLRKKIRALHGLGRGRGRRSAHGARREIAHRTRSAASNRRTDRRTIHLWFARSMRGRRSAVTGDRAWRESPPPRVVVLLAPAAVHRDRCRLSAGNAQGPRTCRGASAAPPAERAGVVCGRR